MVFKEIYKRFEKFENPILTCFRMQCCHRVIERARLMHISKIKIK
jgi:hypothetical protein